MITRQDILEQNLDLAPAIKDIAVKRYIDEAVRFDLKRAIDNEAFYYDFVENAQKTPIEAKWARLWNEHSYTYNEYQYKHEGVKLGLVYLTYARYIDQSNIASTPFGLVTKIGQESEQPSIKQVKDTRTRYERQGNEVIDEVKRYMIRDDSGDYDDYFPSLNAENDIALKVGVLNANTSNYKRYKHYISPNELDEIRQLSKHIY